MLVFPACFGDNGYFTNVLPSPAYYLTAGCCLQDVPAAIRFIMKETKAVSRQVHFVGHSMGGMILVAVMARQDFTAAKIRSATLMGSGCFFEGQYHACKNKTANRFWFEPACITNCGFRCLQLHSFRFIDDALFRQVVG